MEKAEFYAECDRILGQVHEPPKVHKYRGRWGPREPGPGRYEGYGLIRWFSPALVHMALKHPRSISKTVSTDEAIRILEELTT